MNKTIHTKRKTALPRRVLACVTGFLCVATPLFATDSDTVGSIDGTVSVEIAALHQTALKGSAKSQYELGELFEYGRGVQQSDSKATYWYEKSATQNFASAQYRLAILNDNGWGGPANKEKAYILYKAAAEKGVELAQHDLAIAYFQGSGVQKNLLQAYKWLRMAELNGNPLMQKHLNLVAAEMSLEEIDSAQNLAESWISDR